MNIAVLLRGFHYLSRDRFGFPMDGRQYLESLDRCVLGPLRKEHRVKVFVATYPSPFCDEVTNTLRPDGLIILDSKKSDQVGTFVSGLELVSTQFPECDKLICTRFDLTYLKSVLDWNVWREETGIYMPWREYEAFWKERHVVGDAIHVVDKGFIELFAETLKLHRDDMERRFPVRVFRSSADGAGPAARPAHLHGIFDDLAKLTDRLFFIEEGYFDSNTLFCHPECYNPLYRIGNRPRLPVREPGREPADLSHTMRSLQRRWSMFRTEVAAEVGQCRHDMRLNKRTCGIAGVVVRLLQSARAVSAAAVRAVTIKRLQTRLRGL